MPAPSLDACLSWLAAGMAACATWQRDQRDHEDLTRLKIHSWQCAAHVPPVSNNHWRVACRTCGADPSFVCTWPGCGAETTRAEASAHVWRHIYAAYVDEDATLRECAFKHAGVACLNTSKKPVVLAFHTTCHIPVPLFACTVCPPHLFLNLDMHRKDNKDCNAVHPLHIGTAPRSRQPQLPTPASTPDIEPVHTPNSVPTPEHHQHHNHAPEHEHEHEQYYPFPLLKEAISSGATPMGILELDSYDELGQTNSNELMQSALKQDEDLVTYEQMQARLNELMDEYNMRPVGEGVRRTHDEVEDGSADSDELVDRDIVPLLSLSTAGDIAETIFVDLNAGQAAVAKKQRVRGTDRRSSKPGLIAYGRERLLALLRLQALHARLREMCK